MKRGANENGFNVATNIMRGTFREAVVHLEEFEVYASSSHLLLHQKTGNQKSAQDEEDIHSRSADLH